ncbi:hypothetical protein MY10362_009497 [Beauveria mimosiformis]
MFFIFLLLVGALCQDTSPLKRQVKKLRPDLVDHYSSLVKPLLPPRYWAAQPSNYVPPVNIDAKPLCGCRVDDMFQLHDIFISDLATDDFVVDFELFPDSSPLSGDIWIGTSTAITDTSTLLNGSRTAKYQWNALASLAGKSPTWDAFGQEYFELRDKNGNTVTKAEPGGPNILGIEFPPDSVNTTYKHARPHTPSFPVMNHKNEPYTMQLMVDLSWKKYPSKKRASEVVGLKTEDLEALKTEDMEMEIYVLGTNIPGLEVDNLLV